MNWLRTAALSVLGMKRRWLGLVIGCVLWVLWKCFGFWSTLLLMVLAGIGFIVGRVMEENESWRDVVDKLLSERFME
jgi:uncharacterized membrane protein